jgi:hypothetical protein
MEIMNSVQEVHCSSPSELLRKMSYVSRHDHIVLAVRLYAFVI